jgi:AraC-like DNA-binding protein
MSRDVHLARQHRAALRGVEAVTVESNRAFPRHAHDQLALGVIASGAHRTWSAVGTVQAQAGDVVAINPGEMHDGVPIGGMQRAWRMLSFDPGLVAAEIGDRCGPSPEIVRPAVRDPDLRLRLEALFGHLTSAFPDRLALEEALLEALMLAFTRYGARPPEPDGPSPSVGKALRRLDETPEAAVSLSELAALSGVSRFQLLRGFARKVGATPHAYLLQRRVRIAKHLLGAGRTPAQAAAEAGFADQSHMTRAFVRQLGVTPARYRAAVA